MKIGKSKSKGNKFENEISKILGQWIFDDQDVLQRHLTSGSNKRVFVGDIVPIKTIPWKYFPFILECKNGYKNQIPNLANQAILENWLTKLINEKTEQQRIIILIVRFHHQHTLFITDTVLNIYCPLIFNLKYKNSIVPFYIYKLDELKKYEFKSLYEHNDLLKNTIFISHELKTDK